MADGEEQIKSYIGNFIGGIGYSSWYVGISGDPSVRLFNEHHVDKESGRWIFRWAISVDIARCIEKYFIDMGTDGAPGGGDRDSKAVYAYKKESYPGA